MPLEKFATQDAIPEELRESAIETKAGEFVVYREPDTTGLKTALEKERERAKAEEKARKAIEAKLAAAEQEKLAAAAGLTSEKLAEIKAGVEAQFKPALEENAALKARVRSLLLDTQVVGKLAPHVHDAQAAFKLIAEEFDLTDDGKVFAKANPTADLEQYLTGAVKERYPFLFKGTQAAGGDARGASGAGTPSGTDADPRKWTREQMHAFVEQHGLGAYQAKLDAVMQAARAPSGSKAA